MSMKMTRCEFIYGLTCTQAGERMAELEAENAKLRELLDYVTPIAWYAASERERDRMSELGVVVD